MKVPRLVQMVCTPMLVVDDGHELEPLQVDPIVVTGKEWPHFRDHFSHMLQELRDELNADEDEARARE